MLWASDWDGLVCLPTRKERLQGRKSDNNSLHGEMPRVPELLGKGVVDQGLY